MKKLLAVIIITVFLTSLISIKTISGSQTNGTIRGIKHPNAGSFPLGLGDDIPGIDGSSFLESAVADGIVPDLHPNSPWVVQVQDDFDYSFYPLDFQQVLSGVHCNIWVGLSPDEWWNDSHTVMYKDEWVTNGPGFDDDVFYFAYPWSWRGGAFWGAPRLLPGYRDYIYGAQLVQLMNEFDNTIWGSDTSFFGMYKDRAGPLDDYKIQILIFNIRDGLFHDPVNAPYFIEGYFWSYISNLYNANIIHIDTYQWFRRQGPAPNGGEPAKFVNTYPATSRMPYEYEGTFAHEFQHLIHRDIDPDELSWVNEGCSELAQLICGYGFPRGHIEYYLLYWWDASLVDWQGQLENYGASFLFTYYMYEHYGGPALIWDIVHEQANGIQGYNNVLKARKICKNFDQIFQDWAIANYLDDTSFANGIYGYYGLSIPSADTYGYSIQYAMAYWQTVYPTLFQWIVNSYPNEGYAYPYGYELPYIVNYVQFNDGSPAVKIKFDGQEYIGQLPPEGKHEWYSDALTTPWAWFRLGHTFSVPAGGATLEFSTYYDTEPGFDYGYVEVHDLSTGEWTTLPGLYTTDELPYLQDNPNTPDAYEPYAYYLAGKWNAFNGNSGGWYTEQMDLTPFEGHNIELYFTYWTDGGVQLGGWYLDQIRIPEIGFYDNVEHGPDAWTVNTGWYITNGILNVNGAIRNKFNVNFIQTVTLNICDKVTTVDYITHMWVDPKTQDGCALLPAINTKFATFGPSVMVVANQPGFEHWVSTSYSFTANKFVCGH